MNQILEFPMRRNIGPGDWISNRENADRLKSTNNLSDQSLVEGADPNRGQSQRGGGKLSVSCCDCSVLYAEQFRATTAVLGCRLSGVSTEHENDRCTGNKILPVSCSGQGDFMLLVTDNYNFISLQVSRTGRGICSVQNLVQLRVRMLRSLNSRTLCLRDRTSKKSIAPPRKDCSLIGICEKISAQSDVTQITEHHF